MRSIPLQKEAHVKTALIFRSDLLPISETFINDSVAALQRYRPRYACLRRTSPSLPINAAEPIVLARKGGIIARVQIKMLRITGRAPLFRRNVIDAAPDLVHAHFALDGVDLLPIINGLDCPLIVTLHGYDVTTKDHEFSKVSKGRRYLALRSALWSRASQFLCDSQFLLTRALELGYPQDKLQVHYIGTDVNRFKSSPQTRDSNLVLFVGRLVEKKGCEYLMRAMELVQIERPESKLVVIGDGPLRQSLECLARTTNIRCSFLGAQPSASVAEWLGRARVFCAPSVTAANGDSEGLGLVFAEAQATGTPVVSFKHGGVPEVVRDGDTGLLAAERDHQGLARHLSRYLTDDNFWHASSVNGIRWITDQFNLRTQTAKLECIYDDVLNEYEVARERSKLQTGLKNSAIGSLVSSAPAREGAQPP